MGSGLPFRRPLHPVYNGGPGTRAAPIPGVDDGRHAGKRGKLMRAIICIAVLALALPAEAATITVQTIEGGDPAVVVEGPFKAGDENTFRVQTRTMANALVVFQSDGGSADAGLNIGTMIRAKGFATAVQSYCHSACALAWLGGAKRYMGANAEIGFHALFNADTGRGSLVTDAVVVVCAAHMGLSYDAARWIIAKGPNGLNMLTKAEADRLGIAVDVYHPTIPAEIGTRPSSR